MSVQLETKKGCRNMPVSAIVGANWGDEGKGKMTDVLARHSDFVIRYHGRQQRRPYHHQRLRKICPPPLAIGVFYPHTTNILGPGVALNIPSFLGELDDLIARGRAKATLFISPSAHRWCCPITSSWMSTRKSGWGIANTARPNRHRAVLFG